MSVATCMLRMTGQRSPSPSASVTRIRRKTSWTTVITMMTKAAKASEVPYCAGIPKTLRKPPTPLANLAGAVAGGAHEALEGLKMERGHGGPDEDGDGRADPAEHDGQRGDPEADVVDRLGEAPDRQDRPQVAEGEHEQDPEDVA